MTDERRIKFYEGEVGGMTWQSIHPKIFRVRYTRMFSGRLVNVDRNTSGTSEEGVRYDIQRRDPHGDIQSGITVDFVKDLKPVYEGGITDVLTTTNQLEA